MWVGCRLELHVVDSGVNKTKRVVWYDSIGIVDCDCLLIRDRRRMSFHEECATNFDFNLMTSGTKQTVAGRIIVYDVLQMYVCAIVFVIRDVL